MSPTHRWHPAAAAWVLVAAGAALLRGPAQGAETVHLFLKANGAAIQGESSQHSLGRENSIECVSFTQEASTASEVATGLATGRRRYAPIVIRKRVDKSSPLLAKALAQNQPLEGEFRFFRPSPTGDGTTEQFYTIRIKNARISNYKLFVPNCLEPASSNAPPQEEIAFSFQTISFSFNPTGTTFEDDAKQGRAVDPSEPQEREVAPGAKK